MLGSPFTASSALDPARLIALATGKECNLCHHWSQQAQSIFYDS
jgi:hypothetical protein